jgi:hypothetical protein
MRRPTLIPSDDKAELLKTIARRNQIREQLAAANAEVDAVLARLVEGGFGPRPIARALGVSPTRAGQLIAAAFKSRSGVAHQAAPASEASRSEGQAAAPEPQDPPRSASEDPMDVEPQSEAAPESSPVATSPADTIGSNVADEPIQPVKEPSTGLAVEDTSEQAPALPTPEGSPAMTRSLWNERLRARISQIARRLLTHRRTR